MPLLGCIADDFTGGTDLANNLVKSGFRTVQTIGIPKSPTQLDEVDAVVVALKTRTCPAGPGDQRIDRRARLAEILGCRQFYFKYCSTFDSTPRGNIGPVIEALLRGLGESLTIASPAFPDNGRTVYRGHLFVHDQLLNESGMQTSSAHPDDGSEHRSCVKSSNKYGRGLDSSGFDSTGRESGLGCVKNESIHGSHRSHH